MQTRIRSYEPETNHIYHAKTERINHLKIAHMHIPSSITRMALLPPSSKMVRPNRVCTASAIRLPIRVLPVNDTSDRRRSWISCSPTSRPEPSTCHKNSKSETIGASTLCRNAFLLLDKDYGSLFNNLLVIPMKTNTILIGVQQVYPFCVSLMRK